MRFLSSKSNTSLTLLGNKEAPLYVIAVTRDRHQDKAITGPGDMPDSGLARISHQVA